MHQVASRHYAFEGRCFVAASGSRLTRGDMLAGLDSLGPKYADGRELLESIPGDDSRVLLDAGSAVIGPDGGYVAGPHHGSADTVWADIDPGRIDEELMTLDTDGHYSRPDVFTLSVNTGRQRNVEAD
jgi:predicted amidohydrolase